MSDALIRMRKTDGTFFYVAKEEMYTVDVLIDVPVSAVPALVS